MVAVTKPHLSVSGMHSINSNLELLGIISRAWASFTALTFFKFLHFVRMKVTASVVRDEPVK